MSQPGSCGTKFRRAVCAFACHHGHGGNQQKRKEDAVDGANTGEVHDGSQGEFRGSAKKDSRCSGWPTASRPDDQSAKTFSEIKTIQNRSGGEQVKIHAQFGWDLSIYLRLLRNRNRGAEYPVEKMRLFKESLRPLT